MNNRLIKAKMTRDNKHINKTGFLIFLANIRFTLYGTMKFLIEDNTGIISSPTVIFVKTKIRWCHNVRSHVYPLKPRTLGKLLSFKLFNTVLPLMSYINRYQTHVLLMKPKPLQLQSKTSKGYRQVILVIMHKTIDQN